MVTPVRNTCREGIGPPTSSSGGEGAGAPPEGHGPPPQRAALGPPLLTPAPTGLQSWACSPDRSSTAFAPEAGRGCLRWLLGREMVEVGPAGYDSRDMERRWPPRWCHLMPPAPAHQPTAAHNPQMTAVLSCLSPLTPMLGPEGMGVQHVLDRRKAVWRETCVSHSSQGAHAPWQLCSKAHEHHTTGEQTPRIPQFRSYMPPNQLHTGRFQHILHSCCR